MQESSGILIKCPWGIVQCLYKRCQQQEKGKPRTGTTVTIPAKAESWANFASVCGRIHARCSRISGQIF